MRLDKYWLRVVLWMGLIFVISTDLGSQAHTSRIVEPCLRWLNPKITTRSIASVHHILRKTGHFSGYAVLALLTLQAIRNTLGVSAAGWSWRSANWSLVITACYAATDEFHQLFVGSRGASVGDVLIDTTGGAVALLVSFFWIGYHQRRALAETSAIPSIP